MNHNGTKPARHARTARPTSCDQCARTCDTYHMSVQRCRSELGSPVDQLNSTKTTRNDADRSWAPRPTTSVQPKQHASMRWADACVQRCAAYNAQSLDVRHRATDVSAAPGSLDRPAREQLRAAGGEHELAERVDEDP
eukprot:14966355-Alexandrium_andersonii.AAC.1